MEPVVTHESVEVLPWGPGEIELIKPLVLTVTEDPSTSTISVWSEAWNLEGFGPTYLEALLDLSGTAESLFDEFWNADPQQLHESAEAQLRKLLEYIPEPE